MNRYEACYALDDGAGNGDDSRQERRNKPLQNLSYQLIADRFSALMSQGHSKTPEVICRAYANNIVDKFRRYLGTESDSEIPLETVRWILTTPFPESYLAIERAKITASEWWGMQKALYDSATTTEKLRRWLSLNHLNIKNINVRDIETVDQSKVAPAWVSLSELEHVVLSFGHRPASVTRMKNMLKGRIAHQVGGDFFASVPKDSGRKFEFYMTESGADLFSGPVGNILVLERIMGPWQFNVVNEALGTIRQSRLSGSASSANDSSGY
ncbi:hypothetical protein C4579_00035 [Candidatus Microgenomates bacterium]|nr:MAG: hypothetical protein C4579_00035 [Candidatus Microgenomates bacterium]